jgi:hypothetical protein
MECFAGTCLVPCNDGAVETGDGLCGQVSSSLTCMGLKANGDGFCLLKCVDGSCGGDFTCYDAGGAGHQNVCLPIGSFPGSPCHAADGNHAHPYCANFANQTQSCFGGMCLVDCDETNVQTGDALCGAIDASLTCMPMDGKKGLCVPHCVSGQCSTGLSCYGAENACLPNGSFPGSACAFDDTCGSLAVPDGQGGSLTLTQTCLSGTCVVDCLDGDANYGDGLCGAVNAALTCMPANGVSGTGYCTYSCGTSSCPAGLSCFDKAGQHACLPDGSFPGSTCRPAGAAGGRCDDNILGDDLYDQACFSGTCLLTCATDAHCQAFPGADLNCFESMGACLPACTTDAHCGYALGSGMACYASEKVCLPVGSFPGSPCAADAVCQGVTVAPGMTLPQTCFGESAGVDGVCLFVCDPANGGDALCGSFGMICHPAAGVCVPAP